MSLIKNHNDRPKNENNWGGTRLECMQSSRNVLINGAKIMAIRFSEASIGKEENGHEKK